MTLKKLGKDFLLRIVIPLIGLIIFIALLEWAFFALTVLNIGH